MNAHPSPPTPATPDANPFQPHTPDGPFAGRAAALERLHHSLTQAPAVAPMAVTGRHNIGKSALLRQFIDRDPSLVGVVITVDALPLERGEAAFLVALSQMLVDAIQARGFVPDALVRTPDRDDPRTWLVESCLPALYRAIWRRRRVALLLDDAHLLAAALATDALPADLPAYLRSLLGPQLGLGLALLGTDAEPTRPESLADLLPAENVLRLGHLTPDAVAALCGAWLPPRHLDADELARRVFALTGGDPLLLQIVGHHWWGTPDLKAATDAAYADANAHFRTRWSALAGDERRALTAVAALLYDDPLRPVDATRVQAWLVQTDTPLDLTAVQAAMRGLDYHELLSRSTAGARLNGDLLLRWLVEHAGGTAAVPVAVHVPAANPAEGERLRLLLLAALAIMLLLIGIIAAVSLGTGGAASDSVPTVTLAPR